MNFLTPIPAATIGIVAAALAGLVVIAYILKMRRRRFEVPFSTLWQRVLKEKEATSLWRHLKRILSMLLIAAMMGLLLFAALEPELGGRDEHARSVVLIVDASASMKALDEGNQGDRTRLQEAKEKASDLLDDMGEGDSVMLMRMDGRATPLSRFQSDKPKLRRALQDLEATDTPADLHSALSAAADALQDRQHPLIILVGDGAYSEEDLGSAIWKPNASPESEKSDDFASKSLATIDLSGIDVRYVPVGQAKDNVGIVSFNVRRYISNKLNYEVYIELHNFSEKPARRKLVLYNGDLEIDVKPIELKPGERVRRIYPDLGGGEDSVLRAALEPVEGESADAFPLDDQAWALMPASKRQKVLLVSVDNLYLEGALLIFDHLDVDKLTPGDYEAALAASTLPEYDAVVFHEYTPEKLPPSPTHLMYFRPEGPHSPFPVTGSLDRGRITEVSDTHPVMRWIEMSDVNFDRLQVFQVDRSKAEVPLAQSINAPVAASKKDGRRKIVAFGFSMSGTDVMLRVAFPLMMVNSMDWFAGSDADLLTTYATGSRARVPLDGTYGINQVEVTTPRGKKQNAPIQDGHAIFFATEAGVHRLTARDGEQEVASLRLAANLSNPEESDIQPSSELILGGEKLDAPDLGTASHRQSIWSYLTLLVLLLLCVEWYTYNRRITV